MTNGIYSISFDTPAGAIGGGVIVIRDGKAQGGDSAYYYNGTITTAGGAVDADVTVRKHGIGESVFGDLSEFRLRLTGSGTETGFTLNGETVGNPTARVSVRCRRLADA